MQPVAVVTGASSGIGAATAAQLAGAGFHVVLAARRADRLEQAAARARDRGGSVQAEILDVTDPAAAETFARSLDRCDVLVNNAGGAIGMEDVGAADPADWQAMFEVNVLGSLHLTKALLPRLIASGNGTIVMLTSTAGFISYEGGGGPRCRSISAKPIQPGKNRPRGTAIGFCRRGRSGNPARCPGTSSR